MLRFSTRDPFRDLFNFNLDGVFPTTNYNVKESDDSITITTDLPGVKESDIQVASENGILSVNARRKDGTRTYTYSWTLPDTVDVENIAAEYEDGVLTLALPKQEKAKMHRIEVKVKKQLAETVAA